MSEESADSRAQIPDHVHSPLKEYDQGKVLFASQQNLPNSAAVLVLGILSILGCCCYCIPGIIMAIIALFLASIDHKMYFLNPSNYSLSSYQNLIAGRICAIVTLILGSLFLLFILLCVAFYKDLIFLRPHYTSSS